MSDTPRTDAMLQPISGQDCVTGDPISVVHADDCRAMERELAAITAERDALRAAATPQPIETAPKDGTKVLAGGK